MLTVRLIQLIETHAQSLARDVVEDLVTNEHTASFRRIPKSELRPRLLEIYQHLGNWIGDPNDEALRSAYEEWGRIRAGQGIPASELVYSLILIKKHLRGYIREHAQVAFSDDWVSSPGNSMPLELYSIQELNYLVGDFFDRGLYYVIRGYELGEAKRHVTAA
jgi:hypothetical protein